jgi:hypothetical protein
MSEMRLFVGLASNFNSSLGTDELCPERQSIVSVEATKGINLFDFSLMRTRLIVITIY